MSDSIKPIHFSEEMMEEKRREQSAMELASRLGKEAERHQKERESAGKVSAEEVMRQIGERKMEEYRQQQLFFWKSRGGTEAEFEANWPQIKADHIRVQSDEAMRRVGGAY